MVGKYEVFIKLQVATATQNRLITILRAMKYPRDRPVIDFCSIRRAKVSSRSLARANTLAISNMLKSVMK